MKKESERTLKDVLEELMQHYRLRQGNHEWHIRESWARLFGEMIHKHTLEVRLNKRVLYVRVDSAPLRHELHTAREKMKQTINEELGEKYVSEIVIR